MRHTYTHTLIHTHTHTHTHIHSSTHASTNTYAHTHKHTYAHTHLCDFNLTKIDWNAKCTIINHRNADRQLLLTSQRTHLLQQVSSPTHHTNLTDLVFISKYNVITNTLVDMPFSTSDHNTVSFDLSTSVRLLSSSIQLKTRSTLDFSKIDYIGLAIDLLTTNRRSHFSLSDHIDVAWG